MTGGVSGPSIILLYKVLQTGVSLGSLAQEMTQIHEQMGTLTVLSIKQGAEDGWSP